MLRRRRRVRSGKRDQYYYHPLKRNSKFAQFRYLKFKLTIYLRVIDNLASVLAPVGKHLSETLGMHVSIFVGGPEPAKRGQINIIRYVLFMLSEIAELIAIVACTTGWIRLRYPRVGHWRTLTSSRL